MIFSLAEPSVLPFRALLLLFFGAVGLLLLRLRVLCTTALLVLDSVTFSPL
jgi:hypothetical protein